MPDIDVDFSDEGRDKVLVYVRQKYGADRVTQVCTFGTLAARAAVKDAGKFKVEGKEYVVEDGDIMHFRFNV